MNGGIVNTLPDIIVLFMVAINIAYALKPRLGAQAPRQQPFFETYVTREAWQRQGRGKARGAR